MSFERYTVTAALPYANGPKHIGHLAGAYIPADIYVRYLRMCGRDVVFVCGSDEMGAAITLQAIKEGTTPRAIVDRYHAQIRDAFDHLGISFDIYHRTSSEIHRETVQDYFRHLHAKNVFSEETTEQFYDPKAGVFLADRYIRGTCPTCSNDGAFGDQCEACGRDLSPRELIDPVSVLTEATPELRETTHLYLPLDRYESWLRTWLIEGKTSWKANVHGQCASWIDGGLRPRAITRDLDWGVPVPLRDMDGKVLYVWFDAPIGYISATRAWAEREGRDWRPYWQDEGTKLVHFIGKDNIVFHCISFPVMLKEHDDFILPADVPANEFMNLEGHKMSTSRVWSVEMHEYNEAFPDRQDTLRYVLTALMPETRDSEFTWRDLQARHNNELADDIGNFAQRVMVLIHKYFDGRVPDSSACDELAAVLVRQRDAMGDSIERYRFREALQHMMEVARYGNRFLGDNEPWKLIKTDPEKAAVVLYDAVQILANLAVLMRPILPFTSDRILDMMRLDRSIATWQAAGTADLVPGGHVLGEPVILFRKIEDAEVQERLDVLEAKRAARDAQNASAETDTSPQFPPVKDTIQFDDFQKIDLRAGTITEAGTIPKADRLLQLTIDMGFETRTVVSGIAEHFNPDDLVGKRVSVVANLAPRTMRGVESQGMVLMAEDAEGRLHFVSPEEGSANGSVIA